MATAFARCIAQALKAKRISQERADELRDQIEREVAAGGLSQTDELRAQRGMAALDRLERTALRRKANAVRQARSNAWNTAEAVAHPKGAVYGAWSKLARDMSGLARWGNVDSRQHIVARRLHAHVTEAISSLRAKGLIGGRQDVETMAATALELRGKDTGNAAAREFAAAFRSAFEDARTLFNKAGGDIAQRADWGTPQWHDAGRVLRAGSDQWVREITPLIDPARMVRPDGSPMTAADLPDFLAAAYRDITGTRATRAGIKGNTSARHGEHRAIVFRDADAWFAYNEKYGNPDIFSGFINHLDGMAREIGAMQVLGPDPAGGVAALQQSIIDHLQEKPLGSVGKWARDRGWRVNDGASSAHRLEALWHTVMGQRRIGGSVAQMSQAVRQLHVATKLGSAAISSLADEGTMALTAGYNGLSAVRLLGRELKQITGEDARKFAMRAWVGWDSWTRSGVALSRFTDEAIGKGYSSMAAEGVIRASGLNVLTDARRSAFGMEFLGALGELSGRSLDDIAASNPRLARALDGYGITRADWDAMRSATIDFEGAAYVHPEAIMEQFGPARAEALTEKLMRMVLTEADFAVPTPGALERNITGGGLRAGTLGGEVLRHLMTFKTFPVTMMATHLARALNQQTAGAGAAYLAKAAVLTTAMGALAIQARALTQGRTPEDMTRPEFWGAASAQGGGAGLFGDFVFQGVTGSNRFGNSFVTSMLGPSAGMIDDAAKLAFPAMQGDLSPKAFNQFATRHFVPGSSLWYGRLAFDRLVKDQLSLAVDEPSARRSFAARDRFYREKGSNLWWKSGQPLPESLR